MEPNPVTIRAFFGEFDGDRAVRVVKSGRDAETVVQAVYDDLVQNGAMELVVRRTPFVEEEA